MGSLRLVLGESAKRRVGALFPHVQFASSSWALAGQELVAVIGADSRDTGAVLGSSPQVQVPSPVISCPPADKLQPAAASVALGTAFVWSCWSSWKPGINEGVPVLSVGWMAPIRADVHGTEMTLSGLPLADSRQQRWQMAQGSSNLFGN